MCYIIHSMAVFFTVIGFAIFTENTLYVFKILYIHSVWLFQQHASDKYLYTGSKIMWHISFSITLIARWLVKLFPFSNVGYPGSNHVTRLYKSKEFVKILRSSITLRTVRCDLTNLDAVLPLRACNMHCTVD